MKHKGNTGKHLKAIVITGAFIGIGLKLRDSYLIKAFACGMDGHICTPVQFLKDIVIWIIAITVLLAILVFGTKLIIKSVKNFKMPEMSTDKKEEKKKTPEIKDKEPKEESKEEKEEIIKI